MKHQFKLTINKLTRRIFLMATENIRETKISYLVNFAEKHDISLHDVIEFFKLLELEQIKKCVKKIDINNEMPIFTKVEIEKN